MAQRAEASPPLSSPLIPFPPPRDTPSSLPFPNQVAQPRHTLPHTIGLLPACFSARSVSGAGIPLPVPPSTFFASLFAGLCEEKLPSSRECMTSLKHSGLGGQKRCPRWRRPGGRPNIPTNNALVPFRFLAGRACLLSLSSLLRLVQARSRSLEAADHRP